MKNAFFQVRPTTKHGDGLVCCFPKCRDNGIKFRYCAYCKDAIAKRCFRIKHTHGNSFEGKRKANKTSSEPDKKKAKTSNMPNGSAVEAASDRNTAAFSLLSFAETPRADSSPISYQQPSAEAASKESTKEQVMEHSVDVQGSSAERGEHQKKRTKSPDPKVDKPVKKKKVSVNEREHLWFMVLERRPSDLEHREDMLAWLELVQNCSNKNVPIQQVRYQIEHFGTADSSDLSCLDSDSCSEYKSSADGEDSSSDDVSSSS